MSEVQFEPIFQKTAREGSGESDEAGGELLNLGGLFDRAKGWFGALIWEADRAKTESGRNFFQIAAAVLLLAVVFFFASSDIKKPEILAQTGESSAAISTEANTSQPSFDFGSDISQDERDQIEDASRTANSTLFNKAGISLGDFRVHAYSSNESLVNIYMTRFNFPDTKRQEVMVRLAPATAYTEGEEDLFINTKSQGWTTSSPIAEGLILPGRYWTILHECFHLAQSKVGADRAVFPMWLYECSAHYFAGQGMADANLYDYGKIREGQIEKARTVTEPLSSMESAEGFYKAGEAHADEYALGFLAVEKLTEGSADGSSRQLMDFWTQVGSGKPWQIAFEDTFGKSPEQFYTEFEEYRSQGFQ